MQRKSSDEGLTFQSVTIRRRGQLLLDSFATSIAAGETLSVVGPSGAGKSSLLGSVAGLAVPHTGHINRPDGQVSMVFQDPRLLPWRTALQNVALVCTEDRAAQWLDRVGLLDSKDLFPAALSGGMRQRVAIARAFAHNSPVLLVDEPFANLDEKTAQLLRDDLVAQLAIHQRAVIWVTHDHREAAAVAARTLVMDGPPSGSWRVMDHGGDARQLDTHPEISDCNPEATNHAATGGNP